MGRVLTPPGVARADEFFERILARISALERRGGQRPNWQAATLQNGWTSSGTPYPDASYTRVGGRLYLRGLITGGTTTANTVLLTLPVGYRPVARHIFYPWAGGHRVDVLADGTVQLVTYSGTAFISLDQIAFWTS